MVLENAFRHQFIYIKQVFSGAYYVQGTLGISRKGDLSLGLKIITVVVSIPKIKERSVGPYSRGDWENTSTEIWSIKYVLAGYKQQSLC